MSDPLFGRRQGGAVEPRSPTGMRAQVEAFDFATTPLGDSKGWPQSLRTAVRLVLSSRSAMWMAWGPELTFLCNDAYVPLLGIGRTWALGASARDVCAEIWPDVGPRVAQVMVSGEATWDEGVQLPLERSGHPEETYHTFSYSPLSDDHGAIAGVLCVVTEETERVIGERRLAILRQLASHLSTASTEPEVCAAVSACLAAARHDLPFALMYLVDEPAATARLVSYSEAMNGHPLAPRRVEMADATPWPLGAVLRSGEPREVNLASGQHEDVPRGAWATPPSRGLLLPIAGRGQVGPAGALVVGLNPCRPFDEGYRSFLELFTSQLAAGLTNAHAYAAERRRAEASENGVLPARALGASLSAGAAQLACVHPEGIDEREGEEGGLAASRSWEAIERARVGRALSESEERVKVSVEAGELGTFYCPMPLGKIIWNQKCKEHFWLPPDADVDIDLFYAIIHEEDRERTRQAVNDAVFNHEPYDVEYRTVAPDGRWRWIRAKGKAYYDVAGRPTRFDGVTLDVTELKAAERLREESLVAERVAREEAERVNRMKDEFLATLSHELRTPLNAIMGWAQVLNIDSREPRIVKQGLEAILSNARAQTQMIEDLLDMSRIVSGQLRLDVQPVSLAELIDQAVRSVQPMADGRGVRLTTALDAYAGSVSGDPTRLQQVLWNLLTNSIKFTPRGGEVQVALERVNSHIEVSVVDTGEGIAVDFLPHVFGRFQQADASTTRRHGGLGLGLSIVKQLIELHGGSVSVESAGKGQGSTFTLTLPLAIARHEASRAGDGASHHSTASRRDPLSVRQPDLSGVCVLVVDDDADAREIMRKIVARTGAEVVTAESAAAGLELLRVLRPTLLISDIGMPMEDGYDLIRRVRALSIEEGGRTPAVALTAFARSEDRQRALLAGYQMHLSKPVEPPELLAVCASLAGRVG